MGVMAAPSTDVVIVPRNFKLLDEYDAANGKLGATYIKSPHSGMINYGADETQEDMLLHHWEGILIGPQGTHIGELIYSLKIFVPDNYPQVPPEVSFTCPKIKMG